MTRLIRKIAIAVAALAVGITGLELAEALSIPGVYGPVSSAEAVVGRPLTPVSVAGVGRRTVRRCAAGVYYC
jgi:NAD(P)H-dependent flavin oxidoreductase YrpB (nitropropane dioxygenase family)